MKVFYIILAILCLIWAIGDFTGRLETHRAIVGFLWISLGLDFLAKALIKSR